MKKKTDTPQNKENPQTEIPEIHVDNYRIIAYKDLINKKPT